MARMRTSPQAGGRRRLTAHLIHSVRCGNADHTYTNADTAGERRSSAVPWGHLTLKNVATALIFIPCSHDSVVISIVSSKHPLRSIPAYGVVRVLGRYDHIACWRFLHFPLRQKPGHIAFQPFAIYTGL